MTSEKIAALGEAQTAATIAWLTGKAAAVGSVAHSRSLSAENARQSQTADCIAAAIMTSLANPTPPIPVEIRARLTRAAIRLLGPVGHSMVASFFDQLLPGH